MKPVRSTAVIFLATIGLMFNPSAQADDWAQWGGPQRDLIWRETGIADKLPVEGKLLPRVWSTPIGEGYAGPAVANDRVFITDRIRNRNVERVLCLDAESGALKWKHEYEARYTVSYPAGPRSTPVVDDGRVFTVGAVGHMFCFEETTGKILWQKNFVDEYNTKLPIWGMVASPLVDGDQLITLVGGPANALVVSFDKKTGKELWRSLKSKAVGYAPPVIFEFGGVRQLIVWHPEAIESIDPKTGTPIWNIPYRVQAGLSIATPRKSGNRLFVASFYNGPRMIEVAKDGRSAKIAWQGNSNSEVKTEGVHPIMCVPFFDGKNIYSVCSYGQLRCLDAKDGSRLWETNQATGQGRWWNAFLIQQGDRFFIHNEQGELIIAKLTPKGYQEISRAILVEPTRPVRRRQTIWSHPAFAMKSVFARNDKEIVRVNLAK
jgi:outer membrane protein assembly factor BamB